MNSNEFSIGEMAVDVPGSSLVTFEQVGGGNVRMVLSVVFTPTANGPQNPVDYPCGVFDFRTAGNGFGSADTNVFVRFDTGQTDVYLDIEVKTPADKGDFGNLI
jgi:hypothetical protein